MKLTKLFSLLTLITFLTFSCKDACEDLDCGPNGTCVDGSCMCDEGYSGTNCQTNVCDNVDCGDNGTCDNGTCNCDEGYSGANCEINVCDNVDCGANGTCDTTTGNCLCDEGYEGDNCESEIREKHFGIYVGDMNPCMPALAAAALTQEQKDDLAVTEIMAQASATSVMHLDIAATSELIPFTIDAHINEPDFTIPDFDEAVDLGAVTAEVKGNGTGKIIDEMTIELSLMLEFKVQIITAESECTVTFKKP